ncbi:hypothetical protein F2P81_006351 [Scophthalmus maximus]|uniref:Uncharacterized protein n=1 Tax=Scophthalmus maximus TaxID=52904 RepID=A0A6A4T2Z6_SCOMX|nr:hypothetical protein F2P81_006351 [Scophthalmus maximus]
MSVMLKAELEMTIDEEIFWTDSQVVLAYINNEAQRHNVRLKTRFRECCVFVFSAPVYSMALERIAQPTSNANPIQV